MNLHSTTVKDMSKQENYDNEKTQDKYPFYINYLLNK
jgi:hypothetical protein